MQQDVMAVHEVAEESHGATLGEVIVVAGWTLTATLFAFSLGGLVVFYMI